MKEGRGFHYTKRFCVVEWEKWCPCFAFLCIADDRRTAKSARPVAETSRHCISVRPIASTSCRQRSRRRLQPRGCTGERRARAGPSRGGHRSGPDGGVISLCVGVLQETLCGCVLCRLHCMCWKQRSCSAERLRSVFAAVFVCKNTGTLILAFVLFLVL